MWPAKPKMLNIWTFMENICLSPSQAKSLTLQQHQVLSSFQNPHVIPSRLQCFPLLTYHLRLSSIVINKSHRNINGEKIGVFFLSFTENLRKSTSFNLFQEVLQGLKHFLTFHSNVDGYDPQPQGLRWCPRL